VKKTTSVLLNNVKKDVKPSDYFDKKNYIFNRMKKNIQKIGLIMLNPIGIDEKIHLEHLCRENAKLRKILNNNLM